MREGGRLGVRWTVALWLIAAAILCAGLGVGPASRTQEARVLETAREMLGSGTHNWLVPRVNGHIRLQKPPLAYWLTAGAYKTLGVSEGVGRIPAAIAGASAVAVTASAGAWLFGRRAGLLAAAALLGSYQFYRHSRLAETDVLVTVFVTAGAYALWRGYALTRAERDDEGRGETTAAGVGTPPEHQPPRPPGAPGLTLQSVIWFHAAAAAIGLAVLSKGPPAAYPVLFFVLLACFDRQWKPLGRFLLSGAPVTAALIALPWFLYVRQDPDYIQLVRDLKNSAGGGRGHSSLFFTYIPPLFVATAPWSALWLVGLIGAVQRWRRDARLRGMVIWVGSMLIPLSLWGNKQFHYLMPVMPPLMMLVGWLLDESLKAVTTIGEGGRTLVRRLWVATAVAFALAAPGLVVAGRMSRGWIRPADFAVAALLLGSLILVGYLYRTRGFSTGVKAFAAGNVVVLAALVGFWGPTLNPENCRTIAPALQARYGDGPYAFIGKEDLPMVFHMRQIIPVARSPAELAALAARVPPAVVIEPISGTNRPRPAVVEEMRFRDDETLYRVGRLDPAALAAPPPTTSTAPAVGDDDGE